MPFGKDPLNIQYLERDTESAAALLDALRVRANVEVHPSLESLLLAIQDNQPDLLLFDLDALRQSPTSRVGEVLDLRNRIPMALVTATPIEALFPELRRFGLLQIFVKTPPFEQDELNIFLQSVINPDAGFGLVRYLSHTVELYSLAISTIPQKVQAIERAANHFATCGFDVHELYDVRLTLEELTNNSLFHAFQEPPGTEKYSIRTFKQLGSGESVRLEFGSDGVRTGFSVTDNAGTLPIKTILAKLERQYNREGLYDENGRGIYLTRMLSSQMIINIEAQRRTQTLVLFDARRKTDRAKPFVVNYVGPDSFSEWGTDPEMD